MKKGHVSFDGVNRLRERLAKNCLLQLGTGQQGKSAIGIMICRTSFLMLLRSGKLGTTSLTTEEIWGAGRAEVNGVDILTSGES